MLVKEIRRNGLTAWCPSTEHRDLLAVGTLASSIDSGFSAGGTLEIYKLTYDNSTSMPAVASTNLEDRFHKLAWGSLDSSSYGVIAGGMSDGSINFYDPSALLSSKPPLLWSAKEHSGPVQALDFRINKPYLLASGGPNAEILIWALTSESPTAMIPGSPNSQLTGSISVVQWNPQVSHILGTTTFDGVSAVWDLRTKRSVVTFFDPARKYRCRAMAWNPDVATSIVTGSEDDSNPVISIWDLRNTYAPAKELRGHEKGIWSLSWCPNDQNLLVSSSKDNRTICWNTATGKELCEVEKGEMWNLESSWSPRLQSLVSTSSLEGKIRVYSLQDPGPRLTAKGGVGSGVSDEISRAFESPPKWFKRPCGAVFGFGGQLMSWNTKGNKIAVQRLVTDKEFVQRAERLEETIENGKFKEFCESKKSKAEKENNQNEKDMWGCIKVLFENARTPLLELLHFDPATCDKEIADFIRELQKKVKEEPAAAVILEKEEKEIFEEKQQEENNSETEEKIEQEEKVEVEKEKVELEEEEKSSSSDAFEELMGGSNDGDDPFADLIGGSSTTNENEDDPFASIAAASPLPDRFNAQSPGLTQNPSSPLISLPASFSRDIILPFDSTDQEDSILTKAIIVGKFASAVDCCIASNLWADALVLSACGGTELWSQTQKRYLESQLKKKNSKNYLKLIDMIFKHELELAVDSIHLKHWNSILGILCTYGKPEEFPVLCDRLGHRLLKNTPKQTDNNEWAAILCFICSGNLEKIIFILEKREECLVDLIEKIVVLKCSFNENSNNSNKSFNENAQECVGRNYEKYAALLASQGKMREALRYLEMVKEEKSYKRDQILFDRVYNAMIAQEGDHSVGSSSSTSGSTSTSAFDVVDVAENEREFAVGATSQPFGSTSTKDEGSRKVVDMFESAPDTNNLFGRAPSHETVIPPQQPSVQVTAPQNTSYGSSGLSHTPSQPYGQSSQPYGQSSPSFQPTDGGYSHPSQPSQPSQPSSGGYTGGNTTGYTGGPTAGASTGYTGGNTGGYSYQGGGFSSAPTLPSAGQPSNIPSYDSTPPPSYGTTPAPAYGGYAPPSSGNASNPPPGPEPQAAAPAPAAPAPVQINQTGQTIIQGFTAIVQSIDPAVPAMPGMLQKQWTEAKERMNLLFAKLNSGGFGDDADAVVLQFATAIHSNDIVQANQLHKTLASKYWNQIESKIMIGLKRFITVKEFLLKRK